MAVLNLLGGDVIFNGLLETLANTFLRDGVEITCGKD